MGKLTEWTVFTNGYISYWPGYFNKCSIFPATREMQIKTTVIYHIAPFRMAFVNKFDNKFWKYVEEKEFLFTVGRGAN